MTDSPFNQLSRTGITSWLGWTALTGAAWMLLALLPAPVTAQVTRDFDLTSFYQTDSRALAMGNAYGAVARGEGAMLHNPAGLVQYKKDIKLQYAVNIEGEISPSGDFARDTYDLIKGTDTDYTAYLNKYFEETNYYRGQTFYNAVFNLGEFNMGFAGGKMEQLKYSFEFQDTDLNGTVDATDNLVVTKQRLTINFGSAGVALLDGQLMLGATIKSFAFQDEAASDTFGNIIANSSVDLATTGPDYSGTTYDVGMIWRMETLSFIRGQWSLVAYNLGGASLAPADPATQDTLEIPTTYNIGFSMAPEFPLLNLILSMEVEDVTGEIQVYDPADGLNHARSVTQRLHAGAELGLWKTSTGNNVISARAGMHRGNTSVGAELNIAIPLIPLQPRFIYTRYTDNFGYDGVNDFHELELLTVSVDIAF